LFGHDGDDLDGHAVRVRVVARDELDAAFQKLSGHEQVARESIEALDDEDRP